VTVEATGFSIRVNGSQVFVAALSPVKVRFSPPPAGVIATGGLPNFNSESFEGVFDANGRGSFRVRPTAARD
jgi:hypothetical protein